MNLFYLVFVTLSSQMPSATEQQVQQQRRGYSLPAGYIEGVTINFERHYDEHDLLKCYKCENVLSNTMCNSDLRIATCDPEFNTCQTIEFYSDVSRKLTISKTCTMNTSCVAQSQIAAEQFPCDPGSRSSWICVRCCHSDKCNREAGAISLLWSNHNARTTIILLMPIVFMLNQILAAAV